MNGQGSMRRLNDREIRVANFIEQTFWTTGAIPTNEVIAETLGENLKYIKDRFTLEEFREYLVTRGINLSPDNDFLLTTEQLLLANMLLNSYDRRSDREKIKELKDKGHNVSPQKLNAWMKQPAFRGYMQKRSEDMFGSSDWKVRQSLVDTAEDGDVSAIKLFFEMRGIYNPRVDINFNVELLMSKMVDIVAKYVDPQYHEALAEDIENIMDGKSVDMRKPDTAIEVASRMAM